MTDTKQILQQIKQTVQKTEPEAEIILFGSYARGDQRDDSDIDLLILIKNKKEQERVQKIIYPLFDLAFDLGQVISPIVMNKEEWEMQHKFTPLYQNVHKDGLAL